MSWNPRPSSAIFGSSDWGSRRLGIAALGLALVGVAIGGPAACSTDRASTAPRTDRTDRAAGGAGFAIGASEWSRGGRRSVDSNSAMAMAVADTPPSSQPPPAPAATGPESVGQASVPPPTERSTPSDATSAATASVAVAGGSGRASVSDEEVVDEGLVEEIPPQRTRPEASPPATLDREAPPARIAAGTRGTATSSGPGIASEATAPTDPLEAAAAILAAGVRSPDPVIRANALEGMIAWPSLLREHVAGGLVDENRGVRFVAAMCIGRARLADLAHLVEPLVRDSSGSVQAAAIYALRRCGRPVDPSPLAAMVRSDDPEIRSNAYIVLGELGDRSSTAMVRESLGRGMRRVHPIRVRIVELQAAETLVRLGSDDELEVIRAALFAPVEQGELSILACQILARLGDRSAAPMLERLVLASGTSARPPEIRLAAAQALADLGTRTRIDAAAIAADAAEAPDPLLRAQGCAVAGTVGGTVAADTLARRLSDPVELVRITAAGNLLKAIAESPVVADADGVR